MSNHTISPCAPPPSAPPPADSFAGRCWSRFTWFFAGFRSIHDDVDEHGSALPLRRRILSDLEIGGTEIAWGILYWCALLWMSLCTVYLVSRGLRAAAARGWLEGFGLYGPPV